MMANLRCLFLFVITLGLIGFIYLMFSIPTTGNSGKETLSLYDFPVKDRIHFTLDHVVDITRVVDTLKQASLPTTFNLGFELFPEESMKPITPHMPTDKAEADFNKYIQRIQIKCPENVLRGRNEDGGWDACVAGPFSISSPCLVYSLRMNNERMSDDIILKNNKCIHVEYKPVLGKRDAKPKEVSSFNNTGLGISNTVNDKKLQLRTFRNLLEENGHLYKTIDILKMDIEYSEWSLLEAILQEGSLEKVKQLVVKFHTLKAQEGKRSNSNDYSYYWQILRGLDKVGFKKWHSLATPTGHYKSTHSGMDRPCCANVYFVNTKYLA